MDTNKKIILRTIMPVTDYEYTRTLLLRGLTEVSKVFKFNVLGVDKMFEAKDKSEKKMNMIKSTEFKALTEIGKEDSMTKLAKDLGSKIYRSHNACLEDYDDEDYDELKYLTADFGLEVENDIKDSNGNKLEVIRLNYKCSGCTSIVDIDLRFYSKNDNGEYFEAECVA